MANFAESQGEQGDGCEGGVDKGIPRRKIVAKTSKVERRERVVELMKSGVIGVGDCVESCVRSGLRVCGVWVEGVWVWVEGVRVVLCGLWCVG